LLATGSTDKTVKIWDVASGGLLESLNGHSGEINAIAFSPDGNTLATGSFDATVKIWRRATGSEGDAWVILKTFKHHKPVVALAFSPDGNTLATGARDSTPKLWDVDAGVAFKTLNPPSEDTFQTGVLAFSPDGQFLMAGSGYMQPVLLELEAKQGIVPSSAAVIWTVRTGAVLQTVTGHALPVTTVAFSPDGLTLATGSDDETAKIWRRQ
jgi:WD40 repeat protein